jgi:3-hydroxyisobutyrate dehydrogenase
MIAFIWQSDWEDVGLAFARRLADAGHELAVLCRGGHKSSALSAAGAAGAADTAGTTARAPQALPSGIRQARSLADAIGGAEAILTLLATPQEVEDVYLSNGGIFEKAAPASLFIDLSTSSPRLAKELYALAAVHDHSFVEAPFEGDAHSLRILVAGEPDNLARALPLLHILTPRVVVAGLPGSGMALKLASQIALAGALMGLVEAIAFATLSGVEKERVLEVVNESAAASAVARAFGQHILDEDFYHGLNLRLFFNDLTCALDAADDLDLALPGLETAHQLYDLLVLVGGGEKGIHALALIYCDEARCAQHGLNWELAQRAMDVYERASEGYDDYDDYDYDDEECDDPNCGHHHHHYHDEDERPSMGGFFSSN